MSLTDNGCKSVRELTGARIPVADAAKPARIDVEEFEAKLCGISHHAKRKGLVNLHAAAPTVIHQRRICAVLPGDGIIQNLPYPRAQTIACAVRTAAEAADKDHWSGRCPMGQQTRAKRPWIGIQSGGAINRSHIPLQGKTCPPAELNPHIPPILGAILSLHHEPGDDFAFVLISGIGAGSASPAITGPNGHSMRTHLGRLAGTLIYVPVLQRMARILLEAEAKAILERQPYLRRRQVFDGDGVFDRPVFGPRLPFPRQAEPR